MAQPLGMLLLQQGAIGCEQVQVGCQHVLGAGQMTGNACSAGR